MGACGAPCDRVRAYGGGARGRLQRPDPPRLHAPGPRRPPHWRAVSGRSDPGRADEPGRAFSSCSSTRSPTRTRPDGHLQQLGRSLDTPTHWRQDSVRVDWSPGARTRLLLRYTRDSLENGSPSDTDRLLGSDPFPAVDSNLSHRGGRSSSTQPGDIGASGSQHAFGSHGPATGSTCHGGERTRA